MVLKIKSLPVGAGGSSGGSSSFPITWDATASSEAEFIAAIATPQNILITDSFSLTADRALAAGFYRIGRKDESVLTTSTYSLTAASATVVEIVDPEVHNRQATPFLSGNLPFAASANITLQGEYSQTVTTSLGGIGSGVKANLTKTRLRAGVAARASGSSNHIGNLGLLVLEGTGASAYFIISTPAKSGVELYGTYVQDNPGSLNLAATYSLHLNNACSSAVAHFGPVYCDTYTDSSAPAILVGGTTAPTIVESIEGDSTSIGVSEIAVCPVGNSHILGGRYVPVVKANTYYQALFKNSILESVRFESGATSYSFVDCILFGVYSFASGSKPVISGGRIRDQTFASGSNPLVIGATVTDLSTVTISSGAQGIFTNLVREGSAVLTNNDPSTIVQGSSYATWDTVAHTRRFNEATLDSEVLPYIIAYWEGRVMPCPPQSPEGLDGTLRSDAGAVASNGTAVDLDAGTDRCVATIPWYIGSGPFSFSFFFNPDSNSGGEENLFSFMPSYALAVNFISGGNIRVYFNGGIALETSSASVTGSGGEYRITVTRRLNGSTMTLYIYVNGTLRGSLADSTDLGPIQYMILGTAGSSAMAGQYRRLLCVDQGMADATEDLLATYYLKGKGLLA